MVWQVVQLRWTAEMKNSYVIAYTKDSVKRGDTVVTWEMSGVMKCVIFVL
jgi:hypothetical protein